MLTTQQQQATKQSATIDKKQHVRCGGVLAESMVILSAGSAYYTKQTKQTHKPQASGLLLIISIDIILIDTTPHSHTTTPRTYRSNSLLFYGLLPRPHTLILPFFSFLFFSFFSSLSFRSLPPSISIYIYRQKPQQPHPYVHTVPAYFTAYCPAHTL